MEKEENDKTIIISAVIGKRVWTEIHLDNVEKVRLMDNYFDWRVGAIKQLIIGYLDVDLCPDPTSTLVEYIQELYKKRTLLITNLRIDGVYTIR